MSEIAEVFKNDVLIARFDQYAPDWMKLEAEKSFAIQRLQNNSYLMKVAKENPNSLLQAMSNVAGCGLSLNPALNEAHLVPRKGVVCFDPDYRGLCKLATNSGSVLWVHADVVREQDTFINNGIGEKPTHEFESFGKNRGEVIGAFCTAKIHDGSFKTEIMSIDELLGIRDRSEAYKAGAFSPWKSDPEEMMKKTVVKRAWKLWPRSDQVDIEKRLATAIDVSHANDGYELAKTAPDLGQYSDAAKEYFDQLLENEDWVGLIVFKESKSEREWNNLYHSFEKGKKGQYQKIVDSLYQKAESAIADYVLQVDEAAATGEDLDSIVEEMGQLREIVEARVSNEAAMLLRRAAS